MSRSVKRLFSQSVSVTLAGHDHMVGARALQMMPGDILNSTGTTEGILQLDTQPTLDEQAKRDKLANGCYSLANQFTLFASLPVGGFALEWLRNTFRLTDEEIAVSLNRGYADYPAGNWSLDDIPVFIPHLRGSGSPIKSPHPRIILWAWRYVKYRHVNFQRLTGINHGICQLLCLF